MISSAKDKNTIANPASVSCIRKGGTLSIQKGTDGGEYGVCTFDGNRQCEEWALLRGECPAGGVDISGNTSLAAKFCLITGGRYTTTGQHGTVNEQGVCTFQNTACDAWEYYNGRCNRNSPGK